MALLKSTPPKMSLEDQLRALAKQVPLGVLIELTRELADAKIDERTMDEKKRMEGVPTTVIRNIITRNSMCPCESALRLEGEA